MKVGEIWEAKCPIVRVKITKIYKSEHIINPGSISKDKIYVSSIYIFPLKENEKYHHADLAKEDFLRIYRKFYEKLKG